MKINALFLLFLSACQSVVPSIEEVNTPKAVASSSRIEITKAKINPEAAQPVTLMLDLTNVSTLPESQHSFSPYFNGSIIIKKEGEEMPIYQHGFLSSSQLFLLKEIKLERLNIQDRFNVALYGHRDGICTNAFGLYLKPVEGQELSADALASDYSSVYRSVHQTEIKLTMMDFQPGIEDLGCTPGMTQKGTVKNSNGQPIVGAQVKAEVNNSKDSYYQNIQITDQNGQFSMISLPSESPILLTVHHKDYHSTSQTITLLSSDNLKGLPVKEWNLTMNKITS